MPFFILISELKFLVTQSNVVNGTVLFLSFTKKAFRQQR